jgi:anti-sigma regulatory factor (Ser/Thr protein kinase)
VRDRQSDVDAAVTSRIFGVSAQDVAAIDRWVEDVAIEWGLSERTVFRTRLCVAELAANVVEHGVVCSGDNHIALTLSRLGKGVEVDFRDSCGPFDPTRAAPQEEAVAIESASVRGRGLRLLRAYAKDIAYTHEAGSNRVTLRIESD